MDNHLVRKQLKSKRQILTLNEVKELSFLVQHRIINDYSLNQLKNIGLYVSTKNEVSTERLIEYYLKHGKNVYLPKVEGDEINFYLIKKFDDLSRGTFNILEPKENCLQLENVLDVLFVPLVGFDRQLNRLGMGGGYYDRYLANHRLQINKTIGLAYHFQECNFNVYAHDMKLDEIIPDKERIISHF